VHHDALVPPGQKVGRGARVQAALNLGQPWRVRSGPVNGILTVPKRSDVNRVVAVPKVAPAVAVIVLVQTTLCSIAPFTTE
jgi:hypothetical protein